MLGWALLSSLTLVLGSASEPEAALVINRLDRMGMFQHANIRTPHWLGYIVQRPESHSAHHERGVHARNYGDLPLFDIIFGTFHNPRTSTANADLRREFEACRRAPSRKAHRLKPIRRTDI